VLIKQALSLYDQGTALPYVIEQVLGNSGERQLEVGITFVKAALAMSDYSGHRIHTPIKKEIGSGCLQVGDTIITIVGSPCEDYEGEKQERILLWTGETPSAIVPDVSPHTTCYQLSHFVAQIVLLRAVGSKRIMRNWLAGVPF